MTTIKNKKALEVLQDIYLNDKTDISKTDLEKLKVDTSKKKFQIGNLVLEKLWLSDNYDISLADERCDLDGTPIIEHPGLLSKLQSLWFDNKKKITWVEMKKLKIYTSLTSIKIGNFELDSNLVIFGKSYSIDLIDKRKDAEGKWIDEETDTQKVLAELKNFSSKKMKLTTEKAFEKALYTYLDSKFNSVDTQVSIGGVKALKIDLDLGNGQVGLELKLAEKVITSSEKQRLIGQMHDYTTKRYKPENFILAVVGNKKLRTDTIMKEVKQLVETKSHFVFIEG